jgi:hypothetical protein
MRLWFTLILLAIVAAAKMQEDIINSPEIKPTKPVKNNNPIEMSFDRSLIKNT